MPDKYAVNYEKLEAERKAKAEQFSADMEAETEKHIEQTRQLLNAISKQKDTADDRRRAELRAQMQEEIRQASEQIRGRYQRQYPQLFPDESPARESLRDFLQDLSAVIERDTAEDSDADPEG